MAYEAGTPARAGTYRAIFTQTVEVTVPIEVTVEKLEEIAKDLDIDRHSLTYADIEEYITEKGYKNLPGDVCAQCSGWGSQWSRDEGEIELFDEEPIVFVK
jgi:hypothetical protein